MNKLFVMMTAAVILFLPTACQQQNITKDDQQNEANQAPPPLHLGAVHQVYPAQGFALLRIIGPMPKGGAADWIVDMGPEAGIGGGEVVYNGPAADIESAEGSLTADYLTGRKAIKIPERRRAASGTTESPW